MRTIDRRLSKAEEHAEMNKPAVTMGEIDAGLDDLLAKFGSSQEQVIAEYGSLRDFARALEDRQVKRGEGQVAQTGSGKISATQRQLE